MSSDILSKDSPPDIVRNDLKRDEEMGPSPHCSAPAKSRKRGTTRLELQDSRLKIESDMCPETEGASAAIKMTSPRRQRQRRLGFWLLRTGNGSLKQREPIHMLTAIPRKKMDLAF